MPELEFEKKIKEMYEKIEELKKTADDEKIDLSVEIKCLEEKLKAMKKDVYVKLSAWDKLCIARLIERPTSLDYINRIFTNFLELHGDRYFGDDPAIVSGIGFLNGSPMTIIGIQKGKSTKENIERNFGMPCPEGYRKALRLMKQAEKFKRPVVCFIDTPGAYSGMSAEERGQGCAIAQNLFEMSNLKTPIISIIIGEAGSGGALALAVSDMVWMLEYSYYSVLSPEGFASILWKDSKRAKEAADVMKSTSYDLEKFHIIDYVLKEPEGGAHKDVDKMAATIKDNLEVALEELKKEPIDVLLNKRFEKFRRIGIYNEEK